MLKLSSAYLHFFIACFSIVTRRIETVPSVTQLDLLYTAAGARSPPAATSAGQAALAAAGLGL